MSPDLNDTTVHMLDALTTHWEHEEFFVWLCKVTVFLININVKPYVSYDFSDTGGHVLVPYFSNMILKLKANGFRFSSFYGACTLLLTFTKLYPITLITPIHIKYVY